MLKNQLEPKKCHGDLRAKLTEVPLSWPIPLLEATDS